MSDNAICADPEFADAPFCSGPSDPSRRNLPYTSVSFGCSHEDVGYLDIAVGEGSHVVEVNGEVVDEIVIGREDVSDAFGLAAFTYADLPEGDNEAYITTTYEGETSREGGTFTVACAAPAPTPEAPALPAAGLDSALIAVAVILTGVGGLLIRHTR